MEYATLESIRIYSLPIRWDLAEKLGFTINQVKEEQLSSQELLGLLRNEGMYPLIPIIASIVANHRNPDIEIMHPTAEQVKGMKPWLNDVSWIIGKFSRRWQENFDRYIERKGDQAISDVGITTIKILDAIERTGNSPKKDFVAELEKLYRMLATPRYEENLFGQVEVPIEQRIDNALDGMGFVSRGGYGIEFNSDDYPLISTLISVYFPNDSAEIEYASVAAAELMEGLEAFLWKNGAKSLPKAPEQGFDFLNLSSYIRMAVSLTGTLERVKKKVPEMLQLTTNLLPRSGPELSDRMYRLAENIVFLKQQGVSDTEIAHGLVVK